MLLHLAYNMGKIYLFVSYRGTAWVADIHPVVERGVLVEILEAVEGRPPWVEVVTAGDWLGVLEAEVFVDLRDSC